MASCTYFSYLNGMSFYWLTVFTGNCERHLRAVVTLGGSAHMAGTRHRMKRCHAVRDRSRSSAAAMLLADVGGDVSVPPWSSCAFVAPVSMTASGAGGRHRAARGAVHIGLGPSPMAIATVLLRYRKRRCAPYALTFTLGLTVFFAYGTVFGALGHI